MPSLSVIPATFCHSPPSISFQYEGCFRRRRESIFASLHGSPHPRGRQERIRFGVWVPASARTTRYLPRRMGPRIREDDKIVNPSFLTGQLQKGRQDIREMVGTLCVYYMVEEVLDHAAKEII